MLLGGNAGRKACHVVSGSDDAAGECGRRNGGGALGPNGNIRFIGPVEASVWAQYTHRRAISVWWEVRHSVFFHLCDRERDQEHGERQTLHRGTFDHQSTGRDFTTISE